MLVFVKNVNTPYVIAALQQMLEETSDPKMGQALAETIKDIKVSAERNGVECNNIGRHVRQ